jgi:hypothetical protein
LTGGTRLASIAAMNLPLITTAVLSLTIGASGVLACGPCADTKTAVQPVAVPADTALVATADAPESAAAGSVAVAGGDSCCPGKGQGRVDASAPLIIAALRDVLPAEGQQTAARGAEKKAAAGCVDAVAGCPVPGKAVAQKTVTDEQTLSTKAVAEQAVSKQATNQAAKQAARQTATAQSISAPGCPSCPSCPDTTKAAAKPMVLQQGDEAAAPAL